MYNDFAPHFTLGLIKRHAFYIHYNPYANAYRYTPFAVSTLATPSSLVSFPVRAAVTRPSPFTLSLSFVSIDTKYNFSDLQRAMGRHDYISTFDYELDSGCYFIRMIHRLRQALPAATDAVGGTIRQHLDALILTCSTSAPLICMPFTNLPISCS